MPIRLVFRCDYCDVRPDTDTQRTLEGQLLDRRFGEYLDAQPGNWLIFNAGGPLGGRRYACTVHRTNLTADLQAHYGAMCRLVRDEGPYPALWPNGFSSLDERELADLLASGDSAGAAPRAARREVG